MTVTARRILNDRMERSAGGQAAADQRVGTRRAAWGFGGQGRCPPGPPPQTSWKEEGWRGCAPGEGVLTTARSCGLSTFGWSPRLGDPWAMSARRWGGTGWCLLLLALVCRAADESRTETQEASSSLLSVPRGRRERRKGHITAASLWGGGAGALWPRRGGKGNEGLTTDVGDSCFY